MSHFTTPLFAVFQISLFALAGLAMSPKVCAEDEAGSPENSPATAFTNSLGMQFVKIEQHPEAPLFCRWETRVSDYRIFAKATRRTWRAPRFSQTDTHPAVNVSWEDAVAFCRWLTKQDRDSNTIQPKARYRLPTSAEWSRAIGLPISESGTEDLSRAALAAPKPAPVYPWGTEWPPPEKAGNYHAGLAVDSFTFTAPVGSFAPSASGLYDMGGNAWEWCADPFNDSADFRVLRGGSFRMRSPGDLLSGAAIGNVISLRIDAYGFRVVLELPSDEK